MISYSSFSLKSVDQNKKNTILIQCKISTQNKLNHSPNNLQSLCPAIRNRVTKPWVFYIIPAAGRGRTIKEISIRISGKGDPKIFLEQFTKIL